MLLDVDNLRTQFVTKHGVVHAVNGVSFSVDQGHTLGIVGESGCGKSVTATSIMRLIPEPPGRIAAGSIVFEGRDLLELPKDAMCHVRGKEIAMIFQDPMTSLNPVLSIKRQLTEGLRFHLRLSQHEATEQAIELLSRVGIPSARARINDYPHQFSGGMRQRVMIAMALACRPKLLLADEPTTALDVTIQAQILDLMRALRREFNTAVILITHDLGVVAGMCNDVLVMYAGHVVERAPVKELFRRPRHPYTWGLLNSIPRLDQPRGEKLRPIPGLPPDLVDPPPGCPFRFRCRYARGVCESEMPPLVSVGEQHQAACYATMPGGWES